MTAPPAIAPAEAEGRGLRGGRVHRGAQNKQTERRSGVTDPVREPRVMSHDRVSHPVGTSGTRFQKMAMITAFWTIRGMEVRSP